MHERAFLFAENDAAQGALLVDVEDLDRQALFAAEREGGGVHHLEVGAERIVEGDFVEHRGGRILLRVGRVDAVDLRGLDHDLGADFGTAQGGRRVGRHEGVARAGSEDHHAAETKMTEGLAADVRLGDLLDVEGGLNAGLDAVVAAGVLESHGVHDRGEHAHVVARGAVHAGGAECDTAEDVAAAHDDADLNAELDDALDFLNHAGKNRTVDAEAVFAHQGLAGKLEKNALVGGLGRRFRRLIHVVTPKVKL